MEKISFRFSLCFLFICVCLYISIFFFFCLLPLRGILIFFKGMIFKNNANDEMSLFYKTLSLEGLIKKMPENKVFNNYPNTFSFKK